MNVYYIIQVVVVVVVLAFGSHHQVVLSENVANLLSTRWYTITTDSHSNDDRDDLLNDPCIQKSMTDISLCITPKIQNPDTTTQFICCYDWVTYDCVEQVAQKKCTSTEKSTMDKLLNKLKDQIGGTDCKAYPYKQGIDHCEGGK
ncbi:uncharacterized protein LOC128957273 [Oppia nitens]|uniref:uncharacterized protein LOC128957273 n=1 Tax=Oppia nitens TaxID=1686743 RepID=UPI0023D9FC18|nr:uncharacterized protein LOC128957273 [Oppia nitens]